MCRQFTPFISAKHNAFLLHVTCKVILPKINLPREYLNVNNISDWLLWFQRDLEFINRGSHFKAV